MSDKPIPVVQKRYYTPQEFAKLTRVSLSQVYSKIRSGEILAIRPFGPWRIPCGWVEERLKEAEAQWKEENAVDDVADPKLTSRGRVR